MTGWSKEMKEEYTGKAISQMDDFDAVKHRVIPKVYARLKRRPIAASRILAIMRGIRAAKDSMEFLEQQLEGEIEED
jgi:hypothetical protein